MQFIHIINQWVYFRLLLTIINLFGGNVKSTFNGQEFTGIQEILIDLIFAPVLMLFLGFIISIILYLPLWISLKVMKGLTLKGDFIIVGNGEEIRSNYIIEAKGNENKEEIRIEEVKQDNNQQNKDI